MKSVLILREQEIYKYYILYRLVSPNVKLSHNLFNLRVNDVTIASNYSNKTRYCTTNRKE